MKKLGAPSAIKSSLVMICCLFLVLVLNACGAVGLPDVFNQQTVDLSDKHDDVTVLENPHKGWFHHLFDEQSTRYPVSNPAELNDFPGLNHIYLRIPWAVLEPQDDEYNWDFIDNLVSVWQPQGYTASIQVISSSPYNLDYEYASPQWLEELGVEQTRYVVDETYIHYEPDYDNPVFLAKLREFHEAFAERYGQQTWIEDIDIGSYGDFGEGHTSFSSNRAWPVDTVIELLQIYVDNYPHKPLSVSEDISFSGDRPAEEQAQIEAFIDANDISYRDNSVLVDYWLDFVPQDQFSVNRPDLFEKVWREHPTTVELQHYFATRPANNWVGPNGEEVGDSGLSGADILRGALELTHATYLGYHGPAAEWLNDNPDISAELANKIGYWFFLNSVQSPRTAAPGQPTELTLEWENRGVAPAYHPYRVKLRLEGQDTSYDQYLLEADPEQWLPGTHEESYAFSVPSQLPAGDYSMKIKVVDESTGSERPIALGFVDDIKDDDGYYTVGDVTLGTEPSNTTPQASVKTDQATDSTNVVVQGNAPLTVTLDASDSVDAEGDLSYSWSFGDGASEEGESVTHTYDKVGSYVAVLRATDQQGAFDETVMRVNVGLESSDNSFAPIPFFDATVSSSDSSTLAFDASLTSDLDTAGDALDYSWDFGDGTTGDGVQVEHRYQQPGFYDVALTVSDGSQDGSVTQSVKAGDLQPLSGSFIFSTDTSFDDLGNTFDKAFDEDFSTFFDAPEADGAWTGVDLGEDRAVTGFAFAPRIGWESRMIGGTFQGANQADFSDAVDLFTVEAQPTALEYTYAKSGDSTTLFQYVRYIGAANSYGNVAELAFYGE